MPTIRNLSRQKFREFMPGAMAFAISITDDCHDHFPIRDAYHAVLRLHFDDVDMDRERLHPELAAGALGRPLQPFTTAHAKAIIGFGRAAEALDADIVIHCAAGVSRSAAVAEVLLEALAGYADGGGVRHANNYVRRLLRRAFDQIPDFSELRIQGGAA